MLPAVDLPDGVALLDLTTHEDRRGGLTEIFRSTWTADFQPVQWNVVTSRPGVLRGVHVHALHSDYFVVLSGSVTIGLHDLRPTDATGWSGTVEMTGSPVTALVIPPGVAHGFYSHTASTYVYAVDHYWSLEDELGCHWSDPDLAIRWPVADVVLSDRDTEAGSFSELRAAWHAARAT